MKYEYFNFMIYEKAEVYEVFILKQKFYKIVHALYLLLMFYQTNTI
jgi:hypothetical protein